MDNLSCNSGTSARPIVQSDCILCDSTSKKKMESKSPTKSNLWLRFCLAYGALQISFKVFHRQLNQVCWEDNPWSAKSCNPYSTMQLFLNFKRKHFRGSIFKLLQKYTSTEANTFNLFFKPWFANNTKGNPQSHKVPRLWVLLKEADCVEGNVWKLLCSNLLNRMSVMEIPSEHTARAHVQTRDSHEPSKQQIHALSKAPSDMHLQTLQV